MDAEEWFREGNQYMNSKNYEKAIHCYFESLKIDSNKSVPWYNMGLAYLYLNSNPIYHTIFYFVNFFFVANANPYYMEDKIVNCFKTALTINPKFSSAKFNLGLFYHEMEDHKNAVDCFKEVLKLDPENLDALYYLGSSYQELEKYDLELECLKKILSLKREKSNLPIKKLKKRFKELTRG